MRRLITIETEVASNAEFDDTWHFLFSALEDRFQCGDERGDLMARTVTGMRHSPGIMLRFEQYEADT